MDKITFISRLISQEKDDSIFSGRWVRPSSFSDGTKHNDYWIHVKDGVDCVNPEIVLKNDGYVEFTNFDESNEPIVLTYQNFLDNYLIKQ